MLWARVEKGREAKALETKVEPWECLSEYWEAFFTLHSSRIQGMSVGYIPLTEIEAYCSLKGILELDEREQYLLFLRGMDQVYLEHVEKRRSAEIKRNKEDAKKVR